MDEHPLDAKRDPSLAWRHNLKVKMAWAFAAKLLGLTVLWFLFFRGHA
jgi:hypothetical protein